MRGTRIFWFGHAGKRKLNESDEKIRDKHVYSRAPSLFVHWKGARLLAFSGLGCLMLMRAYACVLVGVPTSVRECVCVLAFACVLACVHAYARMRAYVRMCACACARACVRAYACARACLRASVLAYACVSVRECVSVGVRASIRTMMALINIHQICDCHCFDVCFLLCRR